MNNMRLTYNQHEKPLHVLRRYQHYEVSCAMSEMFHQKDKSNIMVPLTTVINSASILLHLYHVC